MLVWSNHTPLIKQLPAHLKKVAAVDVVTTWEEAVTWSKTYHYDLSILDLTQTKKDGITVCQSWRAQALTSGLVIFCEPDVQLRIQYFQAGADDVISRPCALNEVCARITALSKRCWLPMQPTCLTSGCLQYQPESGQIMGPLGVVSLRPTANRLLQAFWRRSHHLCSHYYLVQAGWPAEREPDTNALAVQLRYLRRQLAKVVSYECLVTVHGLGYRWDPPPSSPIRAEQRP